MGESGEYLPKISLPISAPSVDINEQVEVGAQTGEEPSKDVGEEVTGDDCGCEDLLSESGEGI